VLANSHGRMAPLPSWLTPHSTGCTLGPVAPGRALPAFSLLEISPMPEWGQCVALPSVGFCTTPSGGGRPYPGLVVLVIVGGERWRPPLSRLTRHAAMLLHSPAPTRNTRHRQWLVAGCRFAPGGERPCRGHVGWLVVLFRGVLDYPAILCLALLLRSDYASVGIRCCPP